MSTVLITRPRGQGEALAAQLRAAGHTPLQCPALCIEPVPLAAEDRRRLMDLDLYHAVFFVSANAAELALGAFAEVWPQWPVGVHWLAVGEATSRVLESAGLSAEYPRQGFNSEAVLALPCLADVSGQSILICRADTGRDWLAERLRERGARVDVLPLYRRRPSPDFRWPAAATAVLVSSVEGWQAIAAWVPRQALVIAAGERVARVVREAHTGPLEVAASAHDRDMVAALGGRST